MTPWLRSTLRSVLTLRSARLLLVLAVAVALPVYGAVVAYARPGCAADPAPGASAGQGHPPRPGSGQASPPEHAARPDGSDGSDSPPVAEGPDGQNAAGRADGQEDEGGPGNADGAKRGGPGNADGAKRGGPEGHRHGHRPAGHRHGDRDTPAPVPSDSASASYRPETTEPTRAGSVAGEGRLRPGRPDGPAGEVEGGAVVPGRPPGADRAQEPETAVLPSPTPAPADPSGQTGRDQAPPRDAVQQSESATEPVLQLLPLGSGLVLVGLGLGLAFLGLRLRKS